MSFYSNIFRRGELAPAEEGSAEDSRRQAEQRSLQTGSPNADWAVQRRYYDELISRQLGRPIEPYPPPYRSGPDE